MHFREWKLCILIKISLKFVPKGPIDNDPSVGNKPLSEPILTKFTDAYMRHWRGGGGGGGGGGGLVNYNTFAWNAAWLKYQ